MNTAVAEKKPRLTPSAMIASIASEGQRVTAAPFGKALVDYAATHPEVVGRDAGHPHHRPHGTRHAGRQGQDAGGGMRRLPRQASRLHAPPRADRHAPGKDLRGTGIDSPSLGRAMSDLRSSHRVTGSDRATTMRETKRSPLERMSAASPRSRETSTSLSLSSFDTAS